MNHNVFPVKFLTENAASEAILQGIPKGALTEISGICGSGKTELVLKVLAENPEARVAWIEEDFTIYPCALAQHGVQPERVLFVDGSGMRAVGVSRSMSGGVMQVSRKVFSSTTARAGSGESVRRDESKSLWAVHQILRSQVFGIVVLRPSKEISEIELRRLQLAAERAQASVLLLAEEPASAATWPLSVQIHVRRSLETGEPVAEVLKSRGQRVWNTTLQNLMERISQLSAVSVG